MAGAVGLPFSTQGDPHLNLRGYFIHHLRGLLNMGHGDARVLTEEALDGDLARAAAARAAANAAAAEALTSILIQINRSGIVSHSGIKIIGQEH